jgi:Trypsin-like peptidase domain
VTLGQPSVLKAPERSVVIAGGLDMADLSTPDRERLGFEQARLQLERQKLSIEVMLKRRELSGQKSGWLKQLFTNPLVLAIAGGFVTLMTSILTTAFTASQNRDLEARRAAYARESSRDNLQADLIKKFVEGPSRDAVRDNLKFLVDAGLVPTYAKDIGEYLKMNPEAAPQIGFVGGTTGIDNAIALDALPKSDAIVSLGQRVGRILSDDGKETCTAFPVKTDLIATAGHCVKSGNSYTFVLGDERIVARIVSSKFSEALLSNYALLRLEKNLSLAPLKMAETPPARGQLSIVMFRGTPKQLVDRSLDCRILAIRKETFDHLCDTGAGTSGAPIFSSDGEVVGVHGGRSVSRGWATRIDILAPLIK